MICKFCHGNFRRLEYLRDHLDRGCLATPSMRGWLDRDYAEWEEYAMEYAKKWRHAHTLENELWGEYDAKRRRSEIRLDPDILLYKIRQMAAEGQDEVNAADAIEALKAIKWLDEWICAGGRLPKDWGSRDLPGNSIQP